MNSLKFFTVAIAILIAGKSVFAQKTDDKLASERIAYFTEKINLTPDEAAVFWPLYNEYKNKSAILNREIKNISLHFSDSENTLSDKEIKNLLDKRLVLMNEKLVITEEYELKYLNVLPVAKVIRIYITEEDFKRLLLEKLRDNKHKNK